MGTPPHDRRGNKIPGQGVAKSVGRRFSFREGAALKIPQRALATGRLVDHKRPPIVAGDFTQKGIVRAPWKQAMQRQVTLPKELDHPLR